MKIKSLIFLASFVMASFLQAQSVTLQMRTVLGNSDGDGTNGMFWGVLVDTAGDGFAVTPTGTISAFDFTTDGTIGGDSYFVGSATTSFAPPYGGTGVALQTPAISLGSGVDTDDQFGIFWSDGASAYGFVTAATALLPSQGATVDFSGTFNSDPYTAGGTIPEPSTYALLGGLFALGCVMLRRRV